MEISLSCIRVPSAMPPGEVDGKTVVINVDMDFAAQNQIVTVDQRVDEGFKNASLAVIGHFNTGVGGFLPTSFHVPLHKA